MDLEEQANVMGGLQRQRSNQELAELNQQLREMKAAEEAAPKCPYCAGPIAKEVSKCRHCTSDIEWFEFKGLLRGPYKSGQSAEIIALLEVEANETRRRLQKEKAEAHTILKRFPTCTKCFEVNATDSYQAALFLRERSGLCEECNHKQKKRERKQKELEQTLVVLSIVAAICWGILKAGKVF